MPLRTSAVAAVTPSGTKSDARRAVAEYALQYLLTVLQVATQFARHSGRRIVQSSDVTRALSHMHDRRPTDADTGKVVVMTKVREVVQPFKLSSGAAQIINSDMTDFLYRLREDLSTSVFGPGVEPRKVRGEDVAAFMARPRGFAAVGGPAFAYRPGWMPELPSAANAAREDHEDAAEEEEEVATKAVSTKRTVPKSRAPKKDEAAASRKKVAARKPSEAAAPSSSRRRKSSHAHEDSGAGSGAAAPPPARRGRKIGRA